MELNHIWARVGDHQVFQDLSVQSSARHLGLIGANGSGKSSLLRLVQGLLRPQSGTVVIDQPVGMVFQNPDHQILFPTVLEELVFGQTERGLTQAQAEQKALQFGDLHGCSDLLGKATQELSAGQKTLVCLLAAFMDDPKTLLLDESFANLDLVTSRRMTRMIQSTRAKTIFSTHQIDLLKTFDEILWLEQGRIRLQGPPGQVLRAYQTWADTQ